MRNTKTTLHNLERAMKASSFIWFICSLLLHLLHPLEDNQILFAVVGEFLLVSGFIILRIVRIRSLSGT